MVGKGESNKKVTMTTRGKENYVFERCFVEEFIKGGAPPRRSSAIQKNKLIILFTMLNISIFLFFIVSNSFNREEGRRTFTGVIRKAWRLASFGR